MYVTVAAHSVHSWLYELSTPLLTYLLHFKFIVNENIKFMAILWRAITFFLPDVIGNQVQFIFSLDIQWQGNNSQIVCITKKKK